MYDTIWNRVVLLGSGMALGWSLVNYWVAPDSQRYIHRNRLLAALIAAVLLIIVLTVTVPQAGITGLFVFAFAALVAYAGNAKQVSRLPDTPILSAPPTRASDEQRTTVLLVSDGEPVEYDGPLPWAYHIRALEAAGATAPHWFTHPRAYARIRAAYRQMTAQDTLNGMLDTLAKELADALGASYAVESAGLYTTPNVARTLNRLGKEGIRRVIILPLSMDDRSRELLRAQVTTSRVRESGITVIYGAPPFDWPWPAEAYAARLERLTQGEPVSAPPTMNPEEVQSICQHIVAIDTP
ncbi:MAG: hypothetical protein ACOX9A_07130 [Anaerolineae bacterium]